MFKLSLNPAAQIASYRDYLGNIVHHFDIPGPHVQLTLTAERLVELTPGSALPETLWPDAWTVLDRLAGHGDYWEMLRPSRFTQPSQPLLDLAARLEVERQADPLTLLRALNQATYNTFDYAPQSTRVDSPIDEAIAAQRGVCQDFTHEADAAQWQQQQ